MNLVITERCNRACPYCFAKGKIAASKRATPPRNMSLADVEYFVDFLLRSGVPELKLLGGEPTLHPAFRRFVDLGLHHKLRVIVFTNGLWPPSVSDYIRKTPSDDLNFLFNMNEPGATPSPHIARQHRSLRLAGRRGMIGFNLYRVPFDLSFIPDLIDRYDLKREVRLGVAHPIVGENNVFVPDRDLPRLGAHLLQQLDTLEKRGILGALDCGFPLSMFPEDMWGQLVTHLTPGRYSICRPIMDVGPGLSVWPCFPLGRMANTHLRHFNTAKDLERFFDQKLSAIRSMGFIDRCLDCVFRIRGQCCGGCMARTLRNWQHEGDPSLLEKLQ